MELRAGESITIHGLPVGQYTVTENRESAEIGGYALAVKGSCGVEVQAAAAAAVEITNTYTPEESEEPTSESPSESSSENPAPLHSTPPIDNIANESTPLSSIGIMENIEDEDVPLSFIVPRTGDDKPQEKAFKNTGTVCSGCTGIF